MANLYCTATNFGKGFITNKDRYDFYLSGHPGNVWKVGDNIEGQTRGPSYKKAEAWITRVNGTIITRAEAQAIVDAKIEAGQAEYDAQTAEEKLKTQSDWSRVEKYILL
jgi:hypothetical protein